MDGTRIPRRASELKFEEKETHGTTQIEPGTERHQEEKEALARNQEGKIMGRWRLETFRRPV
jgi:hypothetical protein